MLVCQRKEKTVSEGHKLRLKKICQNTSVLSFFNRTIWIFSLSQFFYVSLCGWLFGKLKSPDDVRCKPCTVFPGSLLNRIVEGESNITVKEKNLNFIIREILQKRALQLHELLKKLFVCILKFLLVLLCIVSALYCTKNLSIILITVAQPRFEPGTYQAC